MTGPNAHRDEPETLLRVAGVSKAFGGVQALREAELTVQAGELHFLLGENGAGKSTLGKVIAGVTPPDAGQMTLQGEAFSPGSPLAAQRDGVAMIFQELDLFRHLTIAENIAVRNAHFNEGWFVNRAKLAAFSQPFLERVGLDLSPHRLLGELSMGQMQLVAIARALSMKARLIVMDEPTSSLTDDAVARLFAIIDSLKRGGVGIIYVSHKMQELERIADRITVMRDGRTIRTLAAGELGVDGLISLMVGREVAAAAGREKTVEGELLLSVERLTTRRLRAVSFELRAGEVLGIAGLVGSGRTEIGRALLGIDAMAGGRMELLGRSYTPRDPRHARESGVGMMPEDRKLAGLMMQMSVRENVTLAAPRRWSHWGWIRRGKENACHQEAASATLLRAPSPRHAVSALSGGNQQKALLGRWLMADPRVFFLDDPTRGVDVGAKEDIYGIIRQLAARGKGVMMVSSELPELLRCCDRILVMREGMCVGCLEGRAATQESIMKLAASAGAAA